MFGNEYYNGNEELINYATTTKGHVLILATPATLNVRFCWKYSLFPPPPPKHWTKSYKVKRKLPIPYFQVVESGGEGEERGGALPEVN